jgi:hypothetical protein
MYSVSKSDDGANYKLIKNYKTIRYKDVIELAIPFDLFGFNKNCPILFHVEVMKNAKKIQRYPRKGYLMCHVPSEEFLLENWSI